MVDSLSVMSSSRAVARAANSAAVLASTLYSLIAIPPDSSPPREVKDVAGGLRDLSNGFRELRSILQKVDQGVLRHDLFASIDSVLEQNQALLERVQGLVTFTKDGDARIIFCARGKMRVAGLLAKTEWLKLAVGLVVSILSLVREQDMQSYWTREDDHLDDGDERLILRTQVEILVQAIKESIKDACSSKPITKDKGTQTDELHRTSSIATGHPDLSAARLEPPPDRAHYHSVEVGHTTAEEDTVRWLHNLVFEDAPTYELNRHGDLDENHLSLATLISESSRRSGMEVMDRLLRSWSRLNEDEIQELRGLSPPSGGGNNAAESHDHDHGLARVRVHQMVSKALSYAQRSNTHKPSRDDAQPQAGSKRRASQDDSKDVVVTRVSIHPGKVDADESRQHDKHEVAQKDTDTENKSLQHPQNTSRHRSRTSWVLGPRRARSRSSERRDAAVSTAASAAASASATPSPSSPSSARSRFIEWKSQQAKKFLDNTSSVSHSSFSSSIDKRVQHQQQHQEPPRILQHNPPQKVVFSSPVARLASSSTTAVITENNNNHSLTLRRHSTSRSSPPPTNPFQSPRSSSFSHTSSTTTITTQPTKGILKPPTHHFPEEPNPVREGVAPHKSDKTKRDAAPPGAKWTKIKRSWVNPEALTIGKERFEVLGDQFVKVLRVLSREEIEAYRIATAQLRAMRERQDKEDGRTEARPRRRSESSGGGRKEGEGRGRRESSGGNGSSRYAVQGGDNKGYGAGRKRSPSPPRRRDSGDVPWVLAARST